MSIYLILGMFAVCIIVWLYSAYEGWRQLKADEARRKAMFGRIMADVERMDREGVPRISRKLYVKDLQWWPNCVPLQNPVPRPLMILGLEVKFDSNLDTFEYRAEWAPL